MTMQTRALIVSGVLALLSVGALYRYTDQLKTEVSGGEKIALITIGKAIKKGTPIADDQLSIRHVPSAYVDDRMIRASDRAKVLGVKAERDLDPQQTLEWLDLSLSGQTDRYLSQLVQPGTRALTLQIPPNYMSVELLRPGDYVDLLAIVNEAKTAPESVVLLQRVLVLAVGGETTQAPTARPARGRSEQLLTISVTLQESQTIALAAQKGPIIAVLRSADDSSIATKVPGQSQVVTRDGPPTRVELREAAPGGKPRKLAIREGE